MNQRPSVRFDKVKAVDMDKLVKVSFNLPESTVEALKELARKDATTVTQVLRRAIALEQFAMETVDRGGKVLIEDPDQNLREVLLRR